MSHCISDDEVLRLIERWESLKRTLHYGPEELPTDPPAEIRFLLPDGLTLKDVNQGLGSMRIVRVNPLVAKELKITGARLSVAAHERSLDTSGIDAVAADPVSASSRNWAEADLMVNKLKIMAADARQPASDVEAMPSHSIDFTSVNWFGTRYKFDHGQQAKAVGILWAEFVKGEHGVSEKTIAEAIGSASDNYRLYHTFRHKTRSTGKGKKRAKTVMHEAWNTMIQRAGPGCYRLVKPESP